MKAYLTVDEAASFLNVTRQTISRVVRRGELPVYTTDPKLAPYLDVVNYGRNKGFAGPSNQKAAQVNAQYIVTDTFAKAVQNGDAAAAIEEGAGLLDRIYNR